MIRWVSGEQPRSPTLLSGIMLRRLSDRVLRQIHRDRGASAIEYALLAAAVAATIVALLFVLGGFVVEMFSTTCDSLATEMSATSTC